MTAKKSSHKQINQDYFEESSSYNNTDKLSVLKLSDINSKENENRKALFFIPQIGVSYKSYIEFLKSIIHNGKVTEVITYDHYGCGISGGARGFNSSGNSYLEDCKKIYAEYIDEDIENVVFGHGFGATLSLLVEGEGFFKKTGGIIIKDPFVLNKKDGLISRFGDKIFSDRIKRNLNLAIYSGEDFFPKVEDQLIFDHSCINSRSFSIGIIQTLKKLSKNVVERAYLTEKPILYLHDKNKINDDLFYLYKKGVGENKITRLELCREGSFQNFSTPEKSDLKKINQWIGTTSGESK